MGRNNSNIIFTDPSIYFGKLKFNKKFKFEKIDF